MALTKSGFKGQIGLQFGGELKNGWEKEKRRRRRRREEKEEKIKRYGTMTFIMDSTRLCMTFHACMINSLSPNLGFC